MTGEEVLEQLLEPRWKMAAIIDAAIAQALREERNAIIALHNCNAFVTADSYCDAIRARGTT